MGGANELGYCEKEPKERGLREKGLREIVPQTPGFSENSERMMSECNPGGGDAKIVGGITARGKRGRLAPNTPSGKRG